MKEYKEYIYKRERIADGVYSVENTGIEIVRCKDCVFYESVTEDSGDWCGYWTDRVYVNVRGDGFCAWGERRGE